MGNRLKEEIVLIDNLSIVDPEAETLRQLIIELLYASAPFGDRVFNIGDKVTLKVIVE